MKIETIARKLNENKPGSGHWKQAFGRFQSLSKDDQQKVTELLAK